MNGKEYADRLIEDLENTSKTRRRVSDPFTQVRNLGMTGQTNMQDFMSALNVGEADAHLNTLSQFINSFGTIVRHNLGEKLDVESFKNDVINNRKAVEETFQKILDDQNLMNPFENKPISKYLIETLDHLHNVS